MINFQAAGLRRGAKLLFSDASLQVFPGEKVGIVGRNGCGKTSLFNVFVGRHQVDAGSIEWPRTWAVALMEQELKNASLSALDHVLAGDLPRAQWMQALAKAEVADDDAALVQAHAELDAIDAWQATTRAEQLLAGLGFKADEFQQSVTSFSGGWRIRLNLARALMARSDLLLLDEPTNHLDIEAIAWLEQWLQAYPGTLLLVSHDRDFLNTICQKTLWFEQQQLALYSGNYQQALRQKNERLAQQQALATKQAAQIAHMEDFVRRFKAKASKAKQAQSRLKALERMSPIDLMPLESPFSFRFDSYAKMSDPLLALHDVAIGHSKPLLSRVGLSLRPGDRIGVLGANGAGKSTLLKYLVDQRGAMGGSYVTGEHLRIGYFAQHQLEALDLDASPLLQLQRLDKTATEQSIRTFLGAFNFNEEAVVDSIHHFSGGEKARLALALIAFQRPNVLIMDEPTNHLDIEVRDALLLALQAFEGAIILVSHDRYLLRHCVDQFWLVEAGVVQSFDGDLTTYHARLQQVQSSQSNVDESDSALGTSKKVARQQAAAARKQLAPMKKQLKSLELQVDKVNTRREELDVMLADPALYTSDQAQVAPLLKEKGQLDSKLESLEEEWMVLLEAIEAQQA